MYANSLRFLKLDIIVFDNYILSAKDVAHQKRSGNVPHCWDKQKKFLSSWNSSLSNYKNKEEFDKFLARIR